MRVQLFDRAFASARMSSSAPMHAVLQKRRVGHAAACLAEPPGAMQRSTEPGRQAIGAHIVRRQLAGF